MTQILNIVVLVLAAASLLGAVIFVGKAWQARTRVNRQAYGVGRIEARQVMASAVVRAIVFLLVGLILWGVFGLSLGPAGLFATPAATSTVTPSPQPMATNTVPAATTTLPAPALQDTLTPEATPTNPLLMPTETPTETPTITSTSEPTTVIVNSPNGLWLRETPGGIQEVELIPDGTVLTLLPGRETVDGLEWQQVRTPIGNEGWVAVDFIIY